VTSRRAVTAASYRMFGALLSVHVSPFDEKVGVKRMSVWDCQCLWLELAHQIQSGMIRVMHPIDGRDGDLQYMPFIVSANTCGSRQLGHSYVHVHELECHSLSEAPEPSSATLGSSCY
jgi:hypothetical protein